MSDLRSFVFLLCAVACVTAACGRTGLDQGFDTTNITAGTAGTGAAGLGIGNGESGAAGNGGNASRQGGGAGGSGGSPMAMAIPCGGTASPPRAPILCLQPTRPPALPPC